MSENEITKDPNDYKDIVITKMKKFVEIAEKYNVILLHENEKDIYGDVPERCLTLYKELNSDNFKLIFDFANFVQVDANTWEAYQLLKDYIEYIHIKDAKKDNSQNVVCGTGDGQIERILKEEFNKGYDGFLTLEPHLVKFDELKNLELEDAKQVIKEDLAENGFEGYKMQLNALNEILERI